MKDNTISFTFTLISDPPTSGQKKFDLTINAYDRHKSFILSYTSEYRFADMIDDHIQQEITVLSQDGIKPESFYDGPLKPVGDYATIDVTDDYISDVPLTISQAMNLRNILNADVANTIDKIIDNFTYCFLPDVPLSFDQVKFDIKYDYNFKYGVFDNFEITGYAEDTASLHTIATFEIKVENYRSKCISNKICISFIFQTLFIAEKNYNFDTNLFLLNIISILILFSRF
jgi:hypothetical protein